MFVQGNKTGAEEVLAAMGYLDAWAYMMYNADVKTTPNIDGSIPQLSGGCASGPAKSENEEKFGVRCNVANVACHPDNQMWIQGAPPVYLNNEAPLQSRSLDAISCAIRSCCDQANSRFQSIGQAAAAEQGMPMHDDSKDEMAISQGSIMTPTTMAVMAHGNELCSRNMVLSAFALLQQHEAANLAGVSAQTNQGHHLIISALDAFLQNGDQDGGGGFTDSQIQSFLSVCNTAIENPLLLHHGGPTYHMVSNSAILLCHLLNGMHARRNSGGVSGNSEMEAAIFGEVLDTLLSVRKLLSIHRRKLPVKLRCHAIPRPSFGASGEEGTPFIDMGNTIMCGCRGCQGFVLVACSPCVAAERARNAKLKQEEEAAREAELMIDSTTSSPGEEEDLDRTLYELESEFDMDDDALLGMLSRIVTAP
uniref:Uncharacterized protein n=1 Tax=Grammatophora oceanica TaxID=210454 RepID=A0A7S1Y214_9STRA